MKIYHSLEQYDIKKRSCVTIGTFDGVHIGHQKVIENLIKKAESEKAVSVLLTFFPHPRMVTQKSKKIQLINTIQEKIELLSKTKLDVLIVQEFTKKFSEQSALFFVRDILVNKLHVNHLIVGYDHRFGKNREGGFEQLQEYGYTYDFTVSKIEKKEIDTIAVSSTKIRNAISEGNIEKANSYLGHCFTLSGKVINGKKIGSKIGFPTANIKIEECYKMIPKSGVYAVKSTIKNQEVLGMMNIGCRPTLNGKEQSIEVHFFNFNENLYHQKITVKVLRFLREEKKFNSIEDLKKQLNKDKEKTLQIKDF